MACVVVALLWLLIALILVIDLRKCTTCCKKKAVVRFSVLNFQFSQFNLIVSWVSVEV